MIILNRPQHVTIDLEREHEIYAVAWWHCYDRAAVCWDVVVQVGRDPKFEDAVILFNNDHDGSLGLGKGADLNYIETNEGWMAGADGVVGRYVRLYNHTNTNNLINQYTEVEVYGRLKTSQYKREVSMRTDLQVEGIEPNSEYKFGPVIKCVVHAIDADADSFIDFDTGEYFSVPKKNILIFDFNVWDHSHVVPWAKKTGADATLYYKKGSKKTSWRLSCYDMATTKVQSDYWNTLSAEQVVRHLSNATHFVEDDIGMSVYQPNATHIFKTREGGIGMAQIIDYTEDPKCLKIRYKMVKKATDQKTDGQSRLKVD